MNPSWQLREDTLEAERYRKHFRTRWMVYEIGWWMLVIGSLLGAAWLVTR